MADMDDTSRIESNVEMVTYYLAKEFENFALAYRPDRPLTHTFIVDNGKKQFQLIIEWRALADRNFTPTNTDLLVKGNVAGEMRLHGERGYYWTPSI